MLRYPTVINKKADKEGREEMKRCILEECEGVNCQTVGRSILGESIDCFSVGRGRGRVLIVGAHHALESITANIAYAFIYAMSSPAVGDGGGGILRDILLKSYTYSVIPCLNPDGIEMRFHGAGASPLKERIERMSRGDFSSWQANARGVDLNHNYDAGFYEYKMIEREQGITPGATLYSGEYPESEPECRCVANFVRTVMPRGVISLHSQGGEIFYSPRTRRSARIAGRLAERCGYSVSVPCGTALFGGLCDFTGALGIPSFTIEVGRGVNPLHESEAVTLADRLFYALREFPTLL